MARQDLAPHVRRSLGNLAQIADADPLLPWGSASMAIEYLCTYGTALRPNSLPRIVEALWLLAKQFPQLPSSARDLRPFLAELPGKAVSRQTLFSKLRAFFNAMRDDYDPDATGSFPYPIGARMLGRRQASKGALPDPLSWEDVETLLAQLPRENVAIRILVLTLLLTGVRRGELVSITDRSFTRDSVRVAGKTGERVVALWQAHGVADALFEAWANLAAFQGPGPIFRQRRRSTKTPGLAMTADAVSFQVRAIMRRAGVRRRKLGPHNLRHTFGAHMLQRTEGDIKTVAALLGHANISMTELYTTLSTQALLGRYAGEKPPDYLPKAVALLRGIPKLGPTLADAETGQELVGYVPLAEAARRVKRPKTTVHAWVKAGHVRTEGKVNRHVLVDASDVARMAKRRVARPRTKPMALGVARW